MTPKKALSRRTFLRGSGGILIGLPFLEAMIPILGHAQAAGQAKRFITAFNGSVCGGGTYAAPAAAGAITSMLPLLSFKALEPVKQYLSIVSNMEIPVYNPALGQAPIPGGSHAGQHGFSRGPILSGMCSYDAMQIPQACKTAAQPGNQTSDQYAADALAGSTRFRSLELKVQAFPYNGNSSATNGAMSARKQGNVVSSLPPKVSPLEIYDMLFANLTTSPGTAPAPSAMLLRDKSVLDLVLEDATRLMNSVSGEDKARLDLHFSEIRDVERNIAAQIAGTGGGSAGGTCTKPLRPGPDAPPNTMSFGGWAEETTRGQIQADLIAYALACDLTRVVTWMITHDQCWLNSNKTSGSTVVPNAGGVPDIHADSHSATREIQSGNANWHATLFARLINNLVTRSDAGGPLINNTFLSLISAEGQSAHARTGFTQIVAGNPSKVNLGQHIKTNAAHPALVQIAGLQSLGVNMNNTMGQVSGTIPGLLK